MAVDYKINLAKDLVSSEEKRSRFNRMMLLYLGLCSVGLIVAAYFSSINLAKFLNNRNERRKIMITTLAVSGLDQAAFSNPGKAYADLEKYSFELVTLRTAMASRKQLLPVVHHLFADLPEHVVLQNLSAEKGKVLFGINVPTSEEGVNDPVRELKASWERNENLMRKVSSIRPVKGQRQTMDGNSVFNVQFECVLKK